nr:hypothetical protein [Tanacetum cinerariifolium]
MYGLCRCLDLDVSKGDEEERKIFLRLDFDNFGRARTRLVMILSYTRKDFPVKCTGMEFGGNTRNLAHLGKKRMRLQLYTKVEEEKGIQTLEMASGRSSDGAEYTALLYDHYPLKNYPHNFESVVLAYQLGIQVDHRLEEMTVQQALNQIGKDLLVTVEKHLVLEIIVYESLEMLVDETLKMIEDESLDMIMDETLMIADESHEMIEDESLEMIGDESLDMIVYETLKLDE